MTGTSDTPLPPGLRPEAKLLLWVARICTEDERTAHIRTLLDDGIDWDYLLQLSRHNRLQSLLYWHLKTVTAEAVPPKVMALLQDYFRQATLRNMFHTRELVELLTLFKEKGIASLPYKGPLLAESLYGNLGLRQFWDLDILVHKEDVLRVKDLLVERGYRTERELTRAEERALLDSDSEYNFNSADGRIHIEIHWRILPEPFANSFDARTIWERTVSAELVNTKTLTLPPEELFLVLCMHGGDKHQWTRLKWICDIARFIDKYRNIDWDRIIGEAAKHGEAKTVALGAHLAGALLGADLPNAVGEEVLYDKRVKALAALVRGRLFRQDYGLPGFSEWRCYFNAGNGFTGGGRQTAGGMKTFLLYLQAVMKPEFRDRYTLSLPPWLSFLSYFYRAWRLARSQKGNLINRLR
ncbi:nucleotidyltransferase family protein [Thermodesulfobacteriota bacterium]